MKLGTYIVYDEWMNSIDYICIWSSVFHKQNLLHFTLKFDFL